jgi:hypothetical protein
MSVMVDVGILKADKKLTEKAKKKFIDEVKDIIKFGTEGIPPERKPPFSAGAPMPPAGEDAAKALNDLENENKFPDFHKNTLGLYEKIANALDTPGNFSLLPAIADPIALAGKLGANIEPPDFPAGFIPYFTGNLVPLLSADLVKAGKAEFTIPAKLAAKLPALVGVPLPPKFEIPPSLPIPSTVTIAPSPSAEISPCLAKVPPVIPQNALSTLFATNAAVAEGVPKLVAQVITKIPNIVTKLPNINDALGEICGIVRDSGMFGDIKQTSVTQMASSIVLARKTTECIMLNALANTIGTAPGSVTSGITKKSSGPDAYDQKAPPKPDVAPPPKALPKTEQDIINYYPAK